MICYFHEGRDAAAQCSGCGKFLCKECASAYNPPLCTDCIGQVAATNEASDKKIITLSRVFGGIGIFYTVCIGGLFGLKNGASGVIGALIAGVLLTWYLAGIPFGWRVIGKATSKIFLSLPIVGWLIYFAYKVIFSGLVGMFVMPRFYIKRRREKNS